MKMFFLVCEQTFVLLTKQEIANVDQSNDACILAARFDTQQTLNITLQCPH